MDFYSLVVMFGAFNVKTNIHLDMELQIQR